MWIMDSCPYISVQLMVLLVLSLFPPPRAAILPRCFATHSHLRGRGLLGCQCILSIRVQMDEYV